MPMTVVGAEQTSDLKTRTNLEKDGAEKDGGRSSTEDVCLKQSVSRLNGGAKLIELMHSSGSHSYIGLVLDPLCLGLAFWVFGGFVACIGWMVCVALGAGFKISGCGYSYIGLALGPIGLGLVFRMLVCIAISMGSTVYATLLTAFKYSDYDYSYITLDALTLGPLGLAFVFWMLSGVVAFIGVAYVQLFITVERKSVKCSYIGLVLGPIGNGFLFWMLGGIVSFIGSIMYVALVKSFENFGSDHSYIDLAIGPIGLWIMFWLLVGIVACIGVMVSVKLKSTIKQSGSDYSYIGFVLDQICLGLLIWLLGGIVVCIGSMVYAKLDIISKQLVGDNFYIGLALGPVGMGLIIWLVGGIVSCIGWMTHEVLGKVFKHSGCNYSWRGACITEFVPLVGMALVPQVKMCFKWTCKWIVRPLTNAIMALTFANYLLEPFFPGCQPQLAVILLAAIIIVFLTALTRVNAGWTARLSSVQARRTLLALLIIGLSYRLQGQTTNRPLLSVVMPPSSNVHVPISAADLYAPVSPVPALSSKAEHPLLRDNMTAVAVATSTSVLV